MKTFVITVTGKTEDDLGSAIEEAKNEILEGNVEGGDDTVNGSYHYSEED